MSLKLNILPNKAKFLVYYYLKVGWTCNSDVISQVTDLSLQDIKTIKQYWQLLYKVYIINNLVIEAEDQLCQIYFYKDSIDNPEFFYQNIYAEIIDQLEWHNHKININFENLKSYIQNIYRRRF